MVLEKTLESPLDCEEIQPVHPKGDQFWDEETPFKGRFPSRYKFHQLEERLPGNGEECEGTLSWF